MKNTIVSAAVLTAVLCISSNVLAYSGDGDGSAGNPYQIANVADFQQLSATPTDWNKSFVLTADIVFDPNNPDHIFTQAPIAQDWSASCLDFQGTRFTGIFDGNGHTISNLTITASTQDYVGLFGYVGSSGKIFNLGVENINVTGRNYVGGLTGYLFSGTLTSCHVTGSVSGDFHVGGLVGRNHGMLTSCYATSSISGTGYYAGGLVGLNYGTLTSCYATGSVSGYYCVGGLVGENWESSTTSCYATGSVTGNSYIGGLSGTNYYSTLTNSYSNGLVSGTYRVGGLLGYAPCGTLTGCFWDKQVSGKMVGVGDGISTGVTGKSTAEMKTLSTFTNAGWDFASTWWMPDGNYPRLISFSGPFTLSLLTNPSFITSINPSIGQHTAYGAVSISATMFKKCPDVYKFDHWEGDVADPYSVNTTVSMTTNKTVTAVFALIVPVCGDECHPNFTVGDLNHDCIVDFADLAVFASRWMNCTKPECD